MKLLQQIIDEYAATQPERTIYIRPLSSKSTDSGFEDVSISRVANAINRVAAWLKENIKGTAGQNIAFVASQDLRYQIFILAANKAGHQLILLSPRNSDDAQKHLLGITKCQYFLHSEQYEKTVTQTVASVGSHVKALLIPSIEDILSEDKVEHLPMPGTWDELRYKPFIVMHTSGTSTGKPKPIVINHGYTSLDGLLSTFPKIQGRSFVMLDFESDTRFCHAMPMFHVAALFLTVFKPILQGGAIALLPGDAQIESESVIKTIKGAKCNRMGASPTIIENLMSRSDGRGILCDLQMIGFGSGPLAPEVGDALLKLNINCANMYGSTEMNLLPLLQLDDPLQDWQYMHFHPWSGAKLEPIGTDETMYELVLKPFRVPTHGAAQPVFENFPDAEEYRTKDVFVQHPTKKYLYRWYSRVDDVITFETGEKLNPSTMEDVIHAHPKVAAAVIVGQRRMQPALLIEPVDGVTDHKALLEELWPTIQKANSEAPVYGKLVKQLVHFSEEPFPRTPKGTIQRTKTEEMLAQEINNLYEGGGESVYSSTVDLTSQDKVQEFVREIVHDILDVPTDFDENLNMFDHGLDSLRAAELVRASNTVLKSSVKNGHAPPRIDVSTIYSDPTVKHLTSTLSSLATGTSTAPQDTWAESAQRLLARHIPKIATGAAVLTGSTGSLGAHILHLLLHDPTHTHIYCLNRSSTAKQSYFATFPNDTPLTHKVTFLQTSTLWSHNLGLPHQTYNTILSTTRTVIHNAWPVNFLMAVEAHNPSSYPSTFEPQFDGLANLLHLCSTSTHNARLVYISSLSSVMGKTVKPAPERILTDINAPEPAGYPRSKWVAENILDAVSRQNPTLANPIVIRPGQISGPLKDSVQSGATGPGSMWNAREALPSIFISSAAVGALPSRIGHEEKMRWVPVDVVAKATLEILEHVNALPLEEAAKSAGASAWNVINIHTSLPNSNSEANGGREQTWNDLVPYIQKRLTQKTGKDVEVAEMEEWIRRVEAFGIGDGKENPAIKLSEFMGSLAVSGPDDGLGTPTETERTKSASESLRELGSVKEEWVDFWMEGWRL